MPSNYPTLKDISAEAGVSMALASVVLNGKKSRIKASPATREKILKAAEKFGYEPDRNARALRMSRSFLIGVLTSNISSSFVPNILVGIEKGIMHTNYSLLPVSFQEEKEIASCLEIFRRRKIDGLIIVFTEFREFPKESSMWNRIPKVFIGCSPSLACTSSVCADGFAVGALAADALLRRGCRKFLCLTYANCRNFIGWKKTLESAGIPEESCLVLRPGSNFDTALKKVSSVLKKHPEIDGVFAASDVIGAAVLKVAERLGRRVPEELQVIGVDDSTLCLATSPQLSSIWQPKDDQGEAAARLMLQLLKENKTEQLVLPVHLTERGSIRRMDRKRKS